HGPPSFGESRFRVSGCWMVNIRKSGAAELRGCSICLNPGRQIGHPGVIGFAQEGNAMAKKQGTRAGKRTSASKKVALKKKLVASEAKGRSLTTSDIKVIGGTVRASTSGLTGRTPKRIHDHDRSDPVVWIDGDARDHVQAIDMDTKDVGKHNIP